MDWNECRDAELRRSESLESTELATVLPSVSKSARLRFLNTRSTRANSAVRTLSSARTLESGLAPVAQRSSPEVPTSPPPRPLLPSVRPSVVCASWSKHKFASLRNVKTTLTYSFAPTLSFLPPRLKRVPFTSFPTPSLSYLIHPQYELRLRLER